MRISQLLLAFAALALVLIVFVRAASSTVRGGAAGGGRFAGAGLDGPVDQGGLLAAVRRTELAEARAVAAEARAAAAEARAAQPTAVAVAAGADGGSAAGRLALGKPDDTETNRKLRAALSAAANSRGEVMLALTNDVMMCTNRKTCWWSGGNILETFLQQARRIGLTNYLIVTLDDETERFCRGFGGVPSLRLELPVPSAQQNSRGANMISTLKYGLLKQARPSVGGLILSPHVYPSPPHHTHTRPSASSSRRGRAWWLRNRKYALPPVCPFKQARPSLEGLILSPHVCPFPHHHTHAHTPHPASTQLQAHTHQNILGYLRRVSPIAFAGNARHTPY